MDDFLFRALLAGTGIAIISGPLGCFVVWRRMAYFGDTLAHAALLGVALGLAFGTWPIAGAFAVVVTIALILFLMQRGNRLPGDTLLGILSHGSLSLGLVAIAFMTWIRIDLLSYLFGDILAVSGFDIALIWGMAVCLLAIIIVVWRDCLAATVSRDIAAAEGINVSRADLIIILLIAVVIALAMKLIGVLLITSLLIIPAATARQISRTPEAMAFVASAIGIVSVALGLWGALTFDTPAGPSIVLAALCLFFISFLTRRT
ncbi:MAG: metal ABC transporter permease [Cohaesibacteraceae bacterium]|nr:metal ABC transporter permease [Cohaesibacteraceae bacterium]MBL4875972.1 metal ABC transporter permease [Cohaesibacteraceae bacterium]